MAAGLSGVFILSAQGEPLLHRQFRDDLLSGAASAAHTFRMLLSESRNCINETRDATFFHIKGCAACETWWACVGSAERFFLSSPRLRTAGHLGIAYSARTYHALLCSGKLIFMAATKGQQNEFCYGARR